MIRELYENVKNGVEIRKNLIALRDAGKDGAGRSALAEAFGGDFTLLTNLLESEDPKIRKNAALILGEMESEEMLPILFDAYQRETTLYIRPDYLKAISGLEYRPFLEELRKRLGELRDMEISEESQKHISEEFRVLQSMMLRYEKPKKHQFCGYKKKKELLLLTNRCQREATARQLSGARIKMLAGGLCVKGLAVDAVLPLRTYSELLFAFDAGVLPIDNPADTGARLAPALLAFLCELHRGEPPFFFRIELKGRCEPEKKGAYIRRISDAMEKVSDGKLINSVTDYELELRLLERKDGTFAPMVKLFTIPEKRFAYRKEFVAASIAPVNAALTAELARPFLKEKAQILDPFCGVGTMLIERSKAVPAGTMYGIDIFGEAIEKARENTKRADEQVYYINKDFFTFEHEYLFDEIITNMPQAAAEGRDELRRLYRAFFEKAGVHLKMDGMMILYSTEPGLVSDMLGANPIYRLLKRFLLNEKSKTTVFVIQRVR